MKKETFTEEERKKRLKASQKRYKKRVQRFNLQFNLKDDEVREWFEQQSDKGKYLKRLILADKRQRKQSKEENKNKE